LSSRTDILRSKEARCRRAATLASREDTRRLFNDIADQYRSIADQVERIDKLVALYVGPFAAL